MLVHHKCSDKCPYYQFINNIPTNEDQCPFIDEGKARCWYNSEDLKEKCNCNDPTLGMFLGNSKELGICKNCGHFIIRGKNRWMHYNRAYQCFSPYNSLECMCPKKYDNEEDANVNDPRYDKFMNDIYKLKNK